MPPILYLFWSLIGIGGASALWGPPHAWSGPDPTSKTKLGEPCQQEYRAWSSPQWTTFAQRGTDHCDIVFFAVSTCGRRVRLKIGPTEQMLGTSWSLDHRERVDHKAKATFTFMDPIGGAVLAQQVVSVNCLPWQAAQYNESIYNADGTLRGYE